MNKRLTVILFALLAVTSLLCLAGCVNEMDPTQDKVIATFNLGGGTLDTGSAEIKDDVKYAYDGNCLIVDPLTIINNGKPYKISRAGYEFLGWYKQADGDEKWAFSSDKIAESNVTLYAKWKRLPVYTYTMYFQNASGQEQKVSETAFYSVKKGDTFNDSSKRAKRDGYSVYGYYSDLECTTEWDSNYKHPGGEGENDADVKVYVKYIQGNWTVVSDVEQLVKAIDNGEAVWLKNDIDCKGQELDFGKEAVTINGDDLNDGKYGINNLVVNAGSGNIRHVTCSIFGTLRANSQIKNVDFKNTEFRCVGITGTPVSVKLAALAERVYENVTVDNVFVSGKFVIDREDFAQYEARFKNAIDGEHSAAVNNFDATISTEKIGEN
ncbi:MAG: InlB B-repeat-containing protein [Corallococcus sp.]|nr:InlB B-repeat-containing protein [Corallococcus sp.]